MHLANYLCYLHRAELDLAEGFRKVADGHAQEADVYHTCHTLAKQCDTHAGKLGPFVERYGEEKPEEPERLYHEFFDETRSGGLELLRDMQDLYLMANACEGQTATQIKWLKTRMRQAAPQALLVAS